MSGEDAPRPYLENLIVPEIKTNKQYLYLPKENYELVSRPTYSWAKCSLTPRQRNEFTDRHELVATTCGGDYGSGITRDVRWVFFFFFRAPSQTR